MSSVGSSSRQLSVQGCSTPGRSTDGLVACASPPTSLPPVSRAGSAVDLLQCPLAAGAMRAQEQAALEHLAAERAAAEQAARQAGARGRGARELAALEAAKSELRSRLRAARDHAAVTQAQQRQRAGDAPRWEQVAAEIEARRHAARQLAAVEYAAREEAAQQQAAQQAAARARAYQELAELQRSVTREVQQLQAEAGVVLSPRCKAVSLPSQSTEPEAMLLTRHSAEAILRELEGERVGIVDAIYGQHSLLDTLQPQPQPQQQPQSHQQQQPVVAAKCQQAPLCAWQCVQQRPSMTGRMSWRTEEEWFDALEESGSAHDVLHGAVRRQSADGARRRDKPQRCKGGEDTVGHKKGCCTIM